MASSCCIRTAYTQYQSKLQGALFASGGISQARRASFPPGGARPTSPFFPGQGTSISFSPGRHGTSAVEPGSKLAAARCRIVKPHGCSPVYPVHPPPSSLSCLFMLKVIWNSKMFLIDVAIDRKYALCVCICARFHVLRPYVVSICLGT